MSTMDPTPAERPSAVQTEFATAQSHPISNPVGDSHPAAGSAGNLHDDVATDPSVMQSSAPTMVTVQTDEDGNPFVLDEDGRRWVISRSVGERSQASTPNELAGVPMHPVNLFGLAPINSCTFSTSSARHGPTSVPSSLISTPSEHTPPSNASEPLPALALDVDPDSLTPAQIAQLNAIRAHLGTANARLTVTTAMIAEQQASTEDMHDTIHSIRAEVVSRMDSLRNEVNSQRARLNRCLDDNLRTLRDNGASTTQ
jgi:hypothetical protein